LRFCFQETREVPRWADEELLAATVTPDAEKQAKWLEKVLAEEHERDKKHSDRIELPE
jgi:hypothetical protein